jgi:hypothetical protein
MNHSVPDFGLEITGFKVRNQDVYIDSFLSRKEAVTLSYDQNFFSIAFSDLRYNDLRDITYFHRLTGVDRDWVRSAGPQADYTDIKPGEYTFEVMADRGNGFSPVTSFPIAITPPWWATLLFRALILICAGLFTFFIIRKRIQVIRKEAELKHRIAETEMMALRAQMNPHFIFNCLNSIDAMIQGNDKYKATTYLNKFAKLIRNILDSSTHNKIALSRDIETLRLYVDLELFRHENKFNATIEADETLLQSEYKVPPLIIQPFVENAILHGLRNRPGKDGKLKVVVSRKEDYLHFCIEDNGIGRHKVNGDAPIVSQGYGVQLSSDRIRLFNDEEVASVRITDLEEDGIARGTRVDVLLKIS